MTADQLRTALASLRWSQRGLAEALECDDRMVRRWAAGDASVPPEVGEWLTRLADFARANPPPASWRRRAA